MAFDIFETGGQWVVDVTLRMHGVRRAPLADWCAGTRLDWPAQRIAGIIFGGIASLPAFEARLTFGRDLGISFALAAPALLTLKRFLANVSRFTMPAVAGGAVKFEFGEVKPQASPGSLAGAKQLAYPEAKAAADALKGEAIVIGGLREQILMAGFSNEPRLEIEFSGDGLLTKATLTDPAASLIVTGAGLKNGRAAIKLDMFALVSRLESGRESTGFSLEISKSVQLVSTSRFAIGITGRDLPAVTIRLKGVAPAGISY
jgi:hypothetical protein